MRGYSFTKTELYIDALLAATMVTLIVTLSSIPPPNFYLANTGIDYLYSVLTSICPSGELL